MSVVWTQSKRRDALKTQTHATAAADTTPVLRVETAIRARVGGKFISAEEAGVIAETVTAAFAYRLAAPPRRAPEYRLRPLVSRDRIMRNAVAFGTYGGKQIKDATDEQRREVALRRREEENRL